MRILSHAHLRPLASVAAISLLAVILVATLTSVGSGEEGAEPGTCSYGVRCFWGHLILFGGLAGAIVGWVAGGDPHLKVPGQALLLTVLFIVVFGAADEIAQELWVQGRYGQLRDWTDDVVGGVAGVVVARLAVARVVRPADGERD
ncbi:MAG: VanZ family protein [Dehalococcoidia bacterium]|jgi:hypothetical protein|nr:VanZ family protein [Dehalococcoidia bacterium]